MEIQTKRFYRVCETGKIGYLKGEIDYAGCPSGWYTLIFENGDEGLFTGKEIYSVFL